jgi:hypothetical protein
MGHMLELDCEHGHRFATDARVSLSLVHYVFRKARFDHPTIGQRPPADV